MHKSFLLIVLGALLAAIDGVQCASRRQEGLQPFTAEHERKIAVVRDSKAPASYRFLDSVTDIICCVPVVGVLEALVHRGRYREGVRHNAVLSSGGGVCMGVGAGAAALCGGALLTFAAAGGVVYLVGYGAYLAYDAHADRAAREAAGLSNGVHADGAAATVSEQIDAEKSWRFTTSERTAINYISRLRATFLLKVDKLYKQLVENHNRFLEQEEFYDHLKTALVALRKQYKEELATDISKFHISKVENGWISQSLASITGTNHAGSDPEKNDIVFVKIGEAVVKLTELREASRDDEFHVERLIYKVRISSQHKVCTSGSNAVHELSMQATESRHER